MVHLKPEDFTDAMVIVKEELVSDIKKKLNNDPETEDIGNCSFSTAFKFESSYIPTYVHRTYVWEFLNSSQNQLSFSYSKYFFDRLKGYYNRK